jgi:predicted carbohydrate-binding protein with CBM5 and CBM33 domain
MKELRQLGDTTGMFTNITDEDIENADGIADSTGDIPLGNEVNPYGSEEYSQGFMETQKKNRSNVQNVFKENDEEAGKETNWIDRLKRYIKNYKKVY